LTSEQRLTAGGNKTSIATRTGKVDRRRTVERRGKVDRRRKMERMFKLSMSRNVDRKVNSKVINSQV
jgi:hypothetical protein